MIRIVYIGKENKKRINILRKIDKSIVNIINNTNIDNIISELPNDVIDLFIINELPNVCDEIKNIKKLNHIPIILLINNYNKINDNIDLIVSKKINDNEFLYQVKTLIKVKLMDDELKKEKILLELKVKDRTNELQNKAERLRITFNSIGDGVIVTDKNGYITSMNPISLNVCNLNENDYKNKKITDIFDIIINNKKIDIFYEIINSNKRLISNNAILKIDDNHLRIKYTTSIIFNKKNIMNGVVMVFRDNTKDYYMKKKLSINEQKYRRIYNNIPDVIFTLDLNGKINGINRPYELGYNTYELIGENIDDILDDENIKIKNKYVEKKLDNPNKITMYELYIKNKEGINIPFEIKSLLLFNDKKEPVEIFGIARNIKEKKESENKLIESENKFRLIFDNSSDPIMVSEITPNGPGKFLLFNKSSSIGTGYSEEELYNMTPKDINEPESIEKIENDIKKLFETGNLLSEVVIIKKSGEKIYAENNIHIIKFEGKDAILSIGRDITNRKKTELELIKAKEKAEESDKLKTEFISSITHEIRTPMNSILGFLSLLKNKDLPEHQKNEYINIVTNSGELLLTILDDLIDFSKLNAGTLKLSKKYFDVKDMIKKSKIEFDQLKIQKNKKNINLILNIDETKSCETYSDRDRIKQVLNNLITNAIKFTDKGTIEYGYKQNDKDIIFYVKDTGIGIDNEDLYKIFDRFFRVNHIYRKKQDGTGLGLTISRSIVKLLGGEIWVESEIDKGSTFYFSIPIVKKCKQVNNKKNKIISYNWKNKKVLIAEDDDTNYELMKMVLNPTNIDITHVDNGIDFYNTLKENDFDIILLDIRLKNIDGYELLKYVKNNYNIPVIVQSVLTDKKYVDMSLSLGAEEHISKPIKWNYLLSKIDKILNS